MTADLRRQSLADHIKANDGKIICPGCEQPLYKFIGSGFTGPIQAQDFQPVDESIPQPVQGQPMLCPLCGAALSHVPKYDD